MTDVVWFLLIGLAAGSAVPRTALRVEEVQALSRRNDRDVSVHADG
jgi:hypothetical protein